MKKPLVIGLVVTVLALGSGALGWYLGKRGPRIKGPSLKSFHAQSLSHVPASTIGLTSFDLGWMLEMTIDHDWGLLKPAGNVSELRKALTKVSVDTLGFDLLEAEKASLWVSGLPSPGVAVRIEGGFEGKLKGEETEKKGTTDLVHMHSGAWAALVDGALIVGMHDAVADGIAVADGSGKSLADDDAAAKSHKKVLDAISDGAFITSASVGGLGAFLPDALAGLESTAVALGTDGTFSMAVSGSEDRLKTLLGMWTQAQEQAQKQVDDLQSAAADKGPAGAALGLTFAKAKLEDLRGSIEVQQSGDVATVEAAGPGGILTVYLGVLAGIAIPAFEKYMGRAKRMGDEMRAREIERDLEMERLRTGEPAPAPAPVPLEDPLTVPAPP